MNPGNGHDERVETYLWAEVLRLGLSAGQGRVQHTGILAAGCRGALLVDAVERGVIERTDGQLQFVTDAGDHGMLADLIGDLEHHPNRTLAQTMQRGRPHLVAFIDELVTERVWQRDGLDLGADHSGYRDTDASRVEHLRSQLVEPAVKAFAAAGAHNAALVCLADVLNLGTGSHRSLRQPAPPIVDACGPLGWIVADVTTYLIDAQHTDLAAGRIDGLANSTQLFTS